MPEIDRWLHKLSSNEGGAPGLAQTYNEWADSYDAQMLQVAYLNPAVGAALLSRHVPVKDARVLDAGVGTGLVGPVLNAIGYRDLVGFDLSDGMLAEAAKKNAYRDLQKHDLTRPLMMPDRTFTAVLSLGVIAPGHGPPDALVELARIAKAGGYVIFTIGTLAWEDAGYREAAEKLEASGCWAAVDIAGPYRPMPGSDSLLHTVKAFVYQVSQKVSITSLPERGTHSQV